MFLVPVSRRGLSAAELSSASRALDRFFDDTFEQFFGRPQAAAAPDVRTPALDVKEDDKAYTVTVDLPGVAKDNVKIAVEGKRVTLEAGTERAAEKKEGERVIYRERTAARYARSFTLPAEIDQAASAAQLDQGVLTLTLVKKSAVQAAQIAVN